MTLDMGALHTPASLRTLPVESRIEYAEGLMDELAESIWRDSFSKEDKEKMENIADDMLQGVRQIKELALQIFEED